MLYSLLLYLITTVIITTNLRIVTTLAVEFSYIVSIIVIKFKYIKSNTISILYLVTITVQLQLYATKQSLHQALKKLFNRPKMNIRIGPDSKWTRRREWAKSPIKNETERLETFERMLIRLFI